MSEQPTPSYDSGDLSYDEAHAVPEGLAAPAARAAQRTPVYVATETPDAHGDLSYDLAHDVPRRG